MRFMLGLLVLLLLAPLSLAAPSDEPESTDKPSTQNAKPLDPSFVPVPDDPTLPRVLIIGDSISIGYTIPVRNLLTGIANVHRPAANCGDTARGLKNLNAWLGDGKWDVIVFNFGLHDLKYLDAQGKYVDPSIGKQVAPPPLYETNLRELVARLKKNGAHLIWAATTPVPEGTLGRIAGDEIPYNKVAAQVMADNGIPIADLHAAVLPDIQKLQRPKNVHFTVQGYQVLAHCIVEQVKAALSLPRSPQ